MNDDLDPRTKRQIEAEERYRAEMRAKHEQRTAAPYVTPQPSSGGCLKPVLIAVGIIALAGMFYQMTPAGDPVAPRNPTVQANRLEETKFGEFGQTCSEFVISRLKAPKTAEVSNYYRDRDLGSLTGSYLGGYRWNGYVDAENSFGANIRTNFTCTAGPSEDVVHLEMNP